MSDRPYIPVGSLAEHFHQTTEPTGPVVARLFVNLERSLQPSQEPTKVIYGPSVIGLCGMCVEEKIDTVTKFIDARMQSAWGSAGVNGSFWITARSPRFRYAAEEKRRSDEVKRFELAVNRIITLFENEPKIPCKRDDYFHRETATGLSPWRYSYKIIDERPRIPVAWVT